MTRRYPRKGKRRWGWPGSIVGRWGKKVANCQSIVTWHYCGPWAHVPLLGEVYLPQSWTADRAKLERACVPEDKREFREKWKLALELLDRVPEGLAYEVIVMDAGYGEIRAFLQALDQREQWFVAQIPESQCFWPATSALEERQKPGGRPRRFPIIADPQAQPLSPKAWLLQAEAGQLQWQRVQLRLQQPKTMEVARIRVRETTTQAGRRPGSERWFLIERHQNGSYKYYLSNAPLRTSVRRILHWAHQRWKIEQGYQQLKEELGLDHFEGRS